MKWLDVGEDNFRVSHYLLSGAKLLIIMSPKYSTPPVSNLYDILEPVHYQESGLISSFIFQEFTLKIPKL